MLSFLLCCCHRCCYSCLQPHLLAATAAQCGRISATAGAPTAAASAPPTGHSVSHNCSPRTSTTAINKHSLHDHRGKHTAALSIRYAKLHAQHLLHLLICHKGDGDGGHHFEVVGPQALHEQQQPTSSMSVTSCVERLEARQHRMQVTTCTVESEQRSVHEAALHARTAVSNSASQPGKCHHTPQHMCVKHGAVCAHHAP